MKPRDFWVNNITLKEIFMGAWDSLTSSEPSWSLENPALGQCAVTSLIIQDWFGGSLLRAEVVCGESIKSHYWNLLPGNKEVDLTFGQFINLDPDSQIVKDTVKIRDRYYVLKFPDTKYRYEKLKTNVSLSLLRKLSFEEGQDAED